MPTRLSDGWKRTHAGVYIGVKVCAARQPWSIARRCTFEFDDIIISRMQGSSTAMAATSAASWAVAAAGAAAGAAGAWVSAEAAGTEAAVGTARQQQLETAAGASTAVAEDRGSSRGSIRGSRGQGISNRAIKMGIRVETTAVTTAIIYRDSRRPQKKINSCSKTQQLYSILQLPTDGVGSKRDGGKNGSKYRADATNCNSAGQASSDGAALSEHAS